MEECHGVEGLLGCGKMQGVRLSVVDDSQMVFRLWPQRPDGEVVVARRERDQKIRVRLFLNGDGLRVESGDCGGKEDGRVSRFEGDRQIVDDEFIQGLLNDFVCRERLDKEPESNEDMRHEADGGL